MKTRSGDRAATVLFWTVLFLVVQSRSVQGQALPFPLDMPVPGISSYDPSIPTPESIIGHQIGMRHTLPFQVEAYFRAVAEASDRVVLRVHGKTYEGRNLIHTVVTSPENHARLEQIRTENQRLSEDPSGVTPADIAQMPVVVYQGYSIHGDEASGTEAAILYLYHLAAGQGPAVDDALEHAVVILDPMFNPDGRDRFSDRANNNRGAIPVSDPQDREHTQAWPGGRTNHYWFDLNRDWLPAQHPESQGRLQLFHNWRPQVLTDHHEMGDGSTFFFQPGIPTSNNPHTPERTYQLTHAIAQYHAAVLDRIGSAYFSEESYDDFYLGKGSAYPDVNGSLGILFEQASSRALIRDTEDGVLHYAFTVRNQFATSLSTLEAVVGLRERLLESQRLFYLESAEVAERADIKGYVISLASGRTRAQLLSQLLARHRVKMYHLRKSITINGTDFEAGEAYVVPVDQPQARLVEAIMETTLSFVDSLFYDISTWTLPLAFDVNYEGYRTKQPVMGERYHVDSPDGGRIVGGRAEYAYIMPWDRYYAPRSLYRFLADGIPVRVMKKPFTMETVSGRQHFDRGAIVIPLEGRISPGSESTAEEVHTLVAQAAVSDNVEFYAVSTGLTEDGPDLGGNSSSVITLPRIAILTGTGANVSAAGETWYLLSERFNIPVSLLDIERISNADLGKYNVIVQTGNSLNAAASDAMIEWVETGGRLIVMPSAISWARDQGLVELTVEAQEPDSALQALTYEDRRAAARTPGVGGAILELKLDVTHPLAYGLSETLPVFRRGSTIYSVPGKGEPAFGVYSDRGVLSGYVSASKRAELPGSTGAVARRKGAGRVIVFMDLLSFRAFWYGSDRLFMNALFFGGLF